MLTFASLQPYNAYPQPHMNDSPTTYRPLTSAEIAQLEAQGCSSTSWERVEVGAGFDARYVQRTTLSGAIRIGATGEETTDSNGVVRRTGIYQATLHDVQVGDHAYISAVGRYIRSYDIGEWVTIEHVGEIICRGESAFGCGVEVAAINEAGGREVPIFAGITAQQAYLFALYRDRTQTQERLRAMVEQKRSEATSARGEIGAYSTLLNVSSIVDLRIGSHATIEGACGLAHGTICSTAHSPTYVGTGVIARDFIIAPSARVDTGTLLKRCFVGEGVLLENGFSAENSLFFANSHCTHGEACSVFAGPYTVSHHRSSLLIAGYFSFFNAGSGANQSNHMYKSGPKHQGVHLRGCKFGSDAYILLPAMTGPFTLVTGRHYHHHDTDQMPFSYLVEESKESYLIPGINLRSFGTARDVAKWPNRDRRVGVSSDLIHYQMYSPYTVSRIYTALEHCNYLLGRYPMVEEVTWKRVKIRVSALKKGVLLYERALKSYLSEQLAAWFADGSSALTERPTPEEMAATEAWVDLAGMYLTRSSLGELLDRVDRGEIASMEALSAALTTRYNAYEGDQATFVWGVLSRLLGRPVEAISEGDLQAVVAEGLEAKRLLEEAIAQDAQRDVAPLMSIGYGLDDERVRQADFSAVHTPPP